MNGSHTADQSDAYLYDVENRLVELRARVGTTYPTADTGEIKAKLTCDPMGHFYMIEDFVGGVGRSARKMLYDGDGGGALS